MPRPFTTTSSTSAIRKSIVTEWFAVQSSIPMYFQLLMGVWRSFNLFTLLDCSYFSVNISCSLAYFAIVLAICCYLGC